ncbi:MAG: OB-fold domain-containing protein [Burkholderiales bacterium]|nr:OB-fold domain-containing protein [Burkholderiales bacterium]
MSTVTSSNGFAAGLAEREVRYQICADCGHVQTLARLACRSCGASRLEWRRAAGTGAVFAVTVVSRAPSDEFRALAPYTLVLVDLDEGCRIMGHAEPGVQIGQRVVADFFDHGGRTLLRFRSP